RDSHLPGQLYHSPGQKPVWQIPRQVCELISPHDRERKVSEIPVELVDVSLSAAANVREEQLLSVVESQTARQFELTIARAPAPAQHKRVQSLYDLRLNYDHTLRVALKPVCPHSKLACQRVFDFHIPRRAVRRKVPRHVPAKQKWRTRSVGMLGDV